MLSRDEYVATMKRQLDDWTADMNAWEAKTHEVGKDAMAKYQEQLAALRAKRDEGEKMLDAMRAAGADSWEQSKAKTDNVWQAFRDSAQAFASHFK